jgi:predicted dehydrogenase
MDSKNSKIPLAQIGTKHGHAQGVLEVMIENNDVDVKGVFEPDKNRVEKLKKLNEYPWNKVLFFENQDQILLDPTIKAVASEGRNIESLPQTYEILKSGKHVFYDKPAGDNFDDFLSCIKIAKQKKLFLQMGYMFRNHDGFTKIAQIISQGKIGKIFQIRANMSTNLLPDGLHGEIQISKHQGGILFDLGGHMIDQIVYLLGRPNKIYSFLRRDISLIENYSDNTLAVFEFDKSIATIEINSRTINHMKTRRFEVYGDKGTLILEPFEPAQFLQISLKSSNESLPIDEEYYSDSITLSDKPRYVESFDSFIKSIKGLKKPDRTLEHEVLVQETLLRATNSIIN